MTMLPGPSVSGAIGSAHFSFEFVFRPSWFIHGSVNWFMLGAADRDKTAGRGRMEGVSRSCSIIQVQRKSAWRCESGSVRAIAAVRHFPCNRGQGEKNGRLTNRTESDWHKNTYFSTSNRPSTSKLQRYVHSTVH